MFVPLPGAMGGITVQQLVDSCKGTLHKKESIELQKYNKSGSIKSIKKSWFKNLNKKNAYFDFIENCRLENSLGLKTTITQEHHIIPKHFLSDDKSAEAKVFKNSQENLIRLTVEQHAWAHVLLYVIYGFSFDMGAAALILGSINEAKNIFFVGCGQKGRNTMKRNGTHFHDPETQKTLQIKKYYNKIIKDTEEWAFLKNGVEMFRLSNTGMTAIPRNIILENYGDDLGRSIPALVSGKKKTSKGWSMIRL